MLVVVQQDRGRSTIGDRDVAKDRRVTFLGSDLTSYIKDQAGLLGFDKIGIAPSARLVAEEARLREWLDHGYHGEMQWLAREPERRTNPNAIFPEARSVVVVALNYYTSDLHTDEAATGKVSRYAWGDDYHEIVGGKLRELLARIKQQEPQVNGKVCVDIQPIMDKAWGVRAGLGWIGKHTNLITQELGSWIFLGELLLDVELEYEAVESEDHCGTCTLCIEACPTDAITEPYVLDSNKCISYATIEYRGPNLPEEVGSKLEGWIYGCDICQDVCPWNRFAQATSETGFEARTGNVNSSLNDILDLTPERYAEHFRHSAMKRAKLTGLQRNARQLLENESS
jgi:epoxyqueuosine reductase